MGLFSIVNKVRLFPHKLKTRYKLRRFHKFATIGKNFQTGPAANIFAHNGSIKIGNNSEVLGLLIVKGGVISIGDYTTIRGNSFVGSATKISIGNHVIISNNVHIYDNNNHPTDPQKRVELCESGFYSGKWGWEYSDKAPVVIEDNVWIGERSTILKGVTIGKGSIIGCDSVVTRSIPPYSIAAGNPSRIVKTLPHD